MFLGFLERKSPGWPGSLFCLCDFSVILLKSLHFEGVHHYLFSISVIFYASKPATTNCMFCILGHVGTIILYICWLISKMWLCYTVQHSRAVQISLHQNGHLILWKEPRVVCCLCAGDSWTRMRTIRPRICPDWRRTSLQSWTWLCWDAEPWQQRQRDACKTTKTQHLERLCGRRISSVIIPGGIIGTLLTSPSFSGVQSVVIAYQIHYSKALQI